MHIRHETAVRGRTLIELTTAATEVWREFVNDPTADLPWNAELNIQEEEVVRSVDGAVGPRQYVATVRVTVEQQKLNSPLPPSGT